MPTSRHHEAHRERPTLPARPSSAPPTPAADEMRNDVATTSSTPSCAPASAAPSLLAMGAPLTLALIKTFHTMLEAKLENVNPTPSTAAPANTSSAPSAFPARPRRQVFLPKPRHARLSPPGTRPRAPRTHRRPRRADAVGELLNIVTGNLKSNLCDAGLSSGSPRPP